MMTFGVRRSAFSVPRVLPFLWTSAKHGSQSPNAERRTPNAEGS
jgi:hypothetical protein